jgi:hypothetical protein
MINMLGTSNVTLVDLVDAATVANCLYKAKQRLDDKASDFELVPIEGYDNVDALRVDRRTGIDRRSY